MNEEIIEEIRGLVDVVPKTLIAVDTFMAMKLSLADNKMVFVGERGHVAVAVEGYARAMRMACAATEETEVMSRLVPRGNREHSPTKACLLSRSRIVAAPCVQLCH